VRRAFLFLAAPLLAVLVLASAPAPAQDQAGRAPSDYGLRTSRFTFGGSLGFGFGTVTWVGVSGEVGYLPTDRVWVGLSGTFRYTDDSRYEPSYTATDYGFGVFGRYFVYGGIFGAVEWSWTSYENLAAGTERDNIASVLVGGGYGAPVGGRSSVTFEVLYDVTGNAKGIYGSPWVVRAGFAMGF
jgi:hypothetical protein